MKSLLGFCGSSISANRGDGGLLNLLIIPKPRNQSYLPNDSGLRQSPLLMLLTQLSAPRGTPSTYSASNSQLLLPLRGARRRGLSPVPVPFSVAETQHCKEQ